MEARFGPLRKLRVVEFAGMGPAPFACMLLADMGADVVRLVRPGSGAPAAHDVLARSRITVEADLKNEADRERILGLVDGADAVVEGFRPGVMERLGLGPQALLARNPKLVYGRMTGWGQDGPLAQAAGHDINYVALSGALEAIGTAERPVVPLNLLGDYGGGALYLVAGLLAALLEARDSGQGQVVDAAMCDGAVSLMSAFHFLAARGRWKEQRESNRIDGAAPFYGIYACKDGRHVAVGAIEEPFHRELVARLGLQDDPDFGRRDDPALWPALRGKLQAVFATRSRDEWAALFEGSDACVTPVLSLSESASHVHLRERGTLVTLAGTVQPAAAPRFSRTALQARPPSPHLDTLDHLLARWTEPANAS